MAPDKTIDSDQLTALITAIAEQRDKAAFQALFNATCPRLLAYAQRCGASPSDAEEVVQESMLSVWHKAATFNPSRAAPTTWLYTIVRNNRIDLLRRQRPDRVVSTDLWPEDAGEALESDVESDLTGDLVRTLISGLPDEQRQIIYCVYFQGKSQSEIAQELDLPIGTVKSRQRLAMKKLNSLASEHMTWLIIILLTNF